MGTAAYDPPLAGLRIVDTSTGPMTAIGRLFADLGAEVIVAQMAGVTVDEPVGPHIASVPVQTAIDRHGLPTVEIDTSTAQGRSEFDDLLTGTDIFIESTRPGSAAEVALSVRTLRARHPERRTPGAEPPEGALTCPTPAAVSVTVASPPDWPLPSPARPSP